MEKLMQYVWQHRLWPTARLTTVDGQKISILNPGQLNNDAGPDFTNASIKIGHQYWCGNIEIHVRASDWHRHHHDTDPAYDTVILHVVATDDTRIRRPNGEEIPQILMTCAHDFRDRYIAFVNNPAAPIPCAAELPDIPEIQKSSWIAALAIERIQQKADRILALARHCHSRWDEALYITIARALGFGTNAEPFELLARTTPLRYLRRHADDLQPIEAMLFGQAGLLDNIDLDENNFHYVKALRRDYVFYRAKYGMQQSPNLQWKMSRMRPANFPHRRISTLALLIYNGLQFARQIDEIHTAEQAANLFRGINSLGFWAVHYNFQTRAKGSPRVFSDASIAVLIINVIIPAMYALGIERDDPSLCERALDIAHQIKGENNSITTAFKTVGIEANTACESQALIHLYRNYCQPRKCLYCRFGHRMLSRRVAP